MKAQHLQALLTLAMQDVSRPIILTTMQYAKQLNCSQQSAARLLAELEAETYINRKVSKTGQEIMITALGRRQLDQLRETLNQAFSPKPKSFSGIVKTGLGEGAYYMKLEGYQKQFERRLGYAPFPGTLNLMVSKEIGDRVYDDPSFFTVEGFTANGRSFGGLRAKRCMVSAGKEKIDGAIIIPDRTSHGAETVEVIAKVNLRQKLKLADGKNATLEY